MKPINLDPYTVVSSQLEMRFGDTLLSTGTSFFWEEAGSRYLVTNWHNLSGINPITGKHLNANGGEPDQVRFDIWVNQDLNSRRSVNIPIEDKSGPLWLEHPVHSKLVDVACLKLPEYISPHVFPINRKIEQRLITRVADEVFILGFPLGVGPQRLPVWKRANIASEPDIDVDNLPKFLVDTASAKGMSGSPVIRRTTTAITEDGSILMSGNSYSRFVGIYSGRLISGNSLEAQLGIVWKSCVIREIITGSIKGKRH